MPSIWVLLHAHIVISGTGAFLVIYNFDFFYTQIFFPSDGTVVLFINNNLLL